MTDDSILEPLDKYNSLFKNQEKGLLINKDVQKFNKK